LAANNFEFAKQTSNVFYEKIKKERPPTRLRELGAME
jgi:hypothetical protein